ncbi:MAG TPA: response regulator transcription factor [Spirochaetia bacterium]|nr:response regulator transcription factor [Spirochaetia bacterium]
MIQTIVCDDHPIFREGLKKIVGQSTDIRVAAEASEGRELLEQLERRRFDMIILDITLPGSSGLELLRELKRVAAPPVLILSMHPEEQYASRAIAAGAGGYLSKSSVPEELLTAIRQVAQGKRYVSRTLAEHLADQLAEGDLRQPAHTRLSQREFEVLRLLAAGRKTKEIAEELYVSSPTVATHRARILEKLHMTSTAELVRYAVENHLV